MQGEEVDHERHIAMVPWLAFGHINPFLHLAMSLITSTARRRRRIRVSFLSTPRNLARLPPIPPHLSSLLQLVPLPMPTIVDGLPPTAEATMDIPADKMGHLMLAADLLAGPVSAFLDAATPDVIIHDFFFSWLPPLARRRGVPTVFFSVFSAASLAIVGPPSSVEAAVPWPASPADLTSPAPWIPFPTSVTFRPHEAKSFYHILHLPNSTGVSNAARVHAVIAGAGAVAVRTCTELEPDFFNCSPSYTTSPSYLSACSCQTMASASAVSVAAAAGKWNGWMGGRWGRRCTPRSGVRRNSDKNM